MKRIAIVTGATGGIGREFVRQLSDRKRDIDEIWCIGRNPDKLRSLQEEFGDLARPVCCDLGNAEDFEALINKIESCSVTITWLINSAGLAKMGKYDEFAAEEIANTIDLNCKIVTLLCHFGMQKMERGSRILNISSASSFQPNPYIALYSATKVFVKNYSRALNYELKDTGISCMAVCPGWVDTDMLEKERNGKTIRFPGIVPAERVVRTALSDADKGKDLSVCSLFVKYEHLLSKFLPDKTIMRMWAKGVEKYI